MKLYAPDYYPSFRCIASACRHTCCVGWEIDVDEESAKRFAALPDVAPFIEDGDPPHIRLDADERCPFLREDGLCRMICGHGEDVLCGICRDHPRFRSFWSDRVEIGLGLVCEEAARLILTQKHPLTLTLLEDDGEDIRLPEDEQYLLFYRQSLLDAVGDHGPLSRLEEYLIYRHLPDALYDGRPEARALFVKECVEQISAAWSKAGGGIDRLIELCRAFSYDVEYDEDVLEARLRECEEKLSGQIGTHNID